MPSKFTSTAWMSGMSAAIGWVDGSWSCLQAHAFHAVVNVVHELLHLVALACASVPAQVAEPHVRHLVQDRLAARLTGEVGHPRPEDVVLEEGDRSGVLHRAFLELGHEELVVLPERVLDPERRVVEVEALPGDLEDLVRIEVARERLAAEDAERDSVTLGPHDVPRPRTHK